MFYGNSTFPKAYSKKLNHKQIQQHFLGITGIDLAKIPKQTLTQEHLLGMIGEKVVYAVLKNLFPTKNGFTIEHVNWQKYSYGHGLDFIVYRQDGNIKLKPYLIIEVKNWRLKPKPYGTDTAQTEIISRFNDNKHFHLTNAKRMVILTFEKLLTKKALTILRNNRIHMVTTDKVLGKQDFKSKLFYTLRQQINTTIKTIEDTEYFSMYQTTQLLINNKLVTNKFSNNKSPNNNHSNNTNTANNTNNTKNTIPVSQLMYSYIETEYSYKLIGYIDGLPHYQQVKRSKDT